MSDKKVASVAVSIVTMIVQYYTGYVYIIFKNILIMSEQKLTFTCAVL